MSLTSAIEERFRSHCSGSPGESEVASLAGRPAMEDGPHLLRVGQNSRVTSLLPVVGLGDREGKGLNYTVAMETRYST